MQPAPKTVLIVDDETFVRQSLVDYFEDRLWRTLAAESGERALEILDGESPSGAIVDIRLGGMDGNTFIRRATVKRPDLVFVICTGSPEYEVPADLLALPCVCNTIHRKPVINISDLELALTKTIANLQGRQE